MRGVRKDFCLKREELEGISEFGVIFEGEDGIKRGDDVGGARRRETMS